MFGGSGYFGFMEVPGMLCFSKNVLLEILMINIINDGWWVICS